MHILIVNVYFAPNSFGGATIVAEELGRALAPHRVSAFSAMSRPELAPYDVLRVEADGITNWMINLPHGRRPREIYDNPRVEDQFAKLLTKIAPDVVHFHCVQDLGAGVLRAARNLPSVLSMHDYWWLSPTQFSVPETPKDTQRDRFLRAQVNHADMITTPSRHMRDVIAKHLRPARLTVLENGITRPDPSFSNLHAARRKKDHCVTFGYIGGPSAHKGWPELVDVLSNLPELPMRGVLVDGALNGGWYAGLERQIAKFSGEWSIVPRFSQRSLDAFYADIDVLLFPSQWPETFGLSIREARARGLHVIQTNCGGGAEHGTPDMIPISDTKEGLREAITGAVREPPQMSNPVHYPDYKAQAQALLNIIDKL